MDTARRLATQLPPGEAQTILEKAEGWELLMELHVKSGRFDEVAKLYERARQFDQAGLAWERAGKLSAARKALRAGPRRGLRGPGAHAGGGPPGGAG